MYKIMIKGALLAGTLFLSACATNPRYVQLADNWGRSYETARFNQIIDPEAGVGAMPMEGIDGQAGDRIYKNYQDGFKVKPPPTPVFNLNLGPGS